MSIIERFLEDHRFFRQHMEEARKTAERLPAGEPPPILSDVDREFTQRLRRHARMEAELLFPCLQRASPEDVRHETVKKYLDHGTDEHASVAKRHATLTETVNPSSHLREEWRSALHHFAEGLERHMEMEEREIFPDAARLLTPEILAELNKKADLIP